MMDRAKFERLIAEALDSLPLKFRKRIENLAVVVEPRPPGRRSSRAPNTLTLGLYHGVPLKDRGSYYGNVPPDVIIIYQETIEMICSSEDEVRERIREVVLHEVGHHFGLREEDLRDIERGARPKKGGRHGQEF
jgi:predicted Zn-dependent protease with MMP-like domain